MITTVMCDNGHHKQCPGEGLVQGIVRPPHEPQAEGEKVWVEVPCECPCHTRSTRQ